MKVSRLEKGLYLVATPIGAARDITLRGLDILASADVLAAEDTRNTRRLLDIHGVALRDRKLVSYHDHNGDRQRPFLIEAIRNGQSVAFVSDAGTPLLADPGFDLSRAVIAEDLPLYAAPGPSALLAALCIAGQPTDRFFFAGFAPNKTSARKKVYEDVANIPSTLVFYESPKRIKSALSDMLDIFGPERDVSVCRELTKKFEQVHRGSLLSVQGDYAKIENPKGEFVVVLGPPKPKETDALDLDAALLTALKEMRVKDAAHVVAETFGVRKKDVYARALELKGKP